MKRLILHIGPHKTASTYLQLLWLKNTHQLNEHHIEYPKAFSDLAGHHLLPAYLADANKEKELSSMADEANQLEGNVLMSSENLSEMGVPQLKNLQSLFCYDSITIVAYYRTPTAMLLSIWQEKIKHGLTLTFGDFSIKHLLTPFRSNILNLGLTLDRYSSVFGKASLRVLDFDQLSLTGTLMKSFWEATELPALIEDTGDVVNPMRHLSEIEIIRALNMIAKEHHAFSGSKMRELYVQKRDQISPIVEQLQKEIMLNSQKVFIGNSFIDNRLDSNFFNKWKEQCYHFLRPYQEKVIDLPSSEWLIKRQNIQLIHHLYSDLTSPS